MAAALNRTGSTERRGGLLLSPTSPLRQKAVQAAKRLQGWRWGRCVLLMPCSALPRLRRTCWERSHWWISALQTEGIVERAHRNGMSIQSRHRHARRQSCGLFNTDVTAVYLLCKLLSLAALFVIYGK